MENQGFYIIRNDREIDVDNQGKNFPKYTQHNNSNRFRCEIKYGKDADHLFDTLIQKTDPTIDKDLAEAIYNLIVPFKGSSKLYPSPQLSNIVNAAGYTLDGYRYTDEKKLEEEKNKKAEEDRKREEDHFNSLSEEEKFLFTKAKEEEEKREEELKESQRKENIKDWAITKIGYTKGSISDTKKYVNALIENFPETPLLKDLEKLIYHYDEILELTKGIWKIKV